ncbi:MAG: bis-aminopropyl spermidine synthase family protein [Thermoplasmata archaeon]
MNRIKAQIIQEVAEDEKSVYRVIERQDSSLSEFLEVIDELIKEGILELSDGKLRISESKRYIGKNFKHVEGKCKYCDGTGYTLDGFYTEVLSEFKKITKSRPPASEKFDQGFMDEESVLRRLVFVHERGDIYGRIFIVGDDDLLSLAAGLTGLPKEIVVVEIDERIVNFINTISKKYHLNVTAYLYDVQKSLPEQFKKKFDIFITDPVETIEGIRLFLSRGVSALSGLGCSGYFGLTTLEASRRKWYEIERMIQEMGFVLTDVRRKFNVYPLDEKNHSSFE